MDDGAHHRHPRRRLVFYLETQFWASPTATHTHGMGVNNNKEQMTNLLYEFDISLANPALRTPDAPYGMIKDKEAKLELQKFEGVHTYWCRFF
jgi:hypothetical protein